MRRAVAALALALAPAAFAQGLSVSGTNTVRIERYDTDGFAGASPFPFTTTTGYDELVLNFSWQPSSFDRWRALFAGVANDSPYRSPHRGIVPERMAIARENGAAAIPYRAEAGDFFAFTSIRTQQRPLKGVALELQPVLDHPALRTSLLLFGGAFQPGWRDWRWSDDNTLGLSWLAQAGRVNVTFNALRNRRAADARFGRAAGSQDVMSLAADAPFRMGGSRWRAEAEVAGLRGDPDGAPADAGERSDSALFVQLSGSLARTPLSWRLRGERYGRDYRPYGAAVPADRRSGEAHVSWQSPAALAWRARVQDFRDAYESDRPLRTRVVGAAVSGPWAALGATVNLDVFGQALDRADGSLDQRNLVANAFLSRPFGRWVAQLGLLYQRSDDRLRADAVARTRQAAASLLMPFQWGEVSGSVAPGLTWREVTGSPFATRDLHANLQLALTGGAHRFSLNAGRIAQDPALAPNPEVATVNLGLDYRYRWGRHEIGADLVVFDRRPRPGEDTEAWRAGISWIYAFDALPFAAAPALALAPVPAATTGPIPRDAGWLAAIAPGDELQATLTRLAASGFAGGTRLPGAVVYEARLFPELDERQRAVLVHAGGRIERAVLIVSLAATGGAQEPARVYERVRRSLIERFGRPQSTFEEGAFGAGFAADVAAGRLVRIAEWHTDRGIVRVGIPRRLDGSARIEVHHARSFPSPRDTAWGLEAVR